MDSKYAQYFSQMKNKRILLISDTVIDQFIYGTTTKIAPDAPVPIVSVIKEENDISSIITVINLILEFGGDVDIISVVGTDTIGESFLKQIKELNRGITGIYRANTNTPTITRIISQNQQLLRIEKRYNIDQSEIRQMNTKIQKFCEEKIDSCDAVLILDHNLGLLNPILISQLLAVAKQKNKKVIACPEEIKYIHYRDTYLIAMNQNIASKATGVNVINETSMRITGTKILNELHSNGVLISWVEGNSYYFQSDDVSIFPSLLNYPPKSFSNIGGSISAILALMTSINAPVKDSVEMAHFAGSIAAFKNKKEYISLKELENVIKNGKITIQ